MTTGEKRLASGSKTTGVGPPGHWVERWRERLPEGSWRRRRYDSLFLPVSAPTEFIESYEDLATRLWSEIESQDAAARSEEILAEAQKVFADAEARGEGAERRATTLQGAVAIATSVLLAGGALLGDPSKIHGGAWRSLLALALFVVTVCLVMAGARALAATARIHVYHRPSPDKILERAGKDASRARIDLAAETLKDYGFNHQVASWKVAYLAAAAWWFRGALISLLVLASLLSAYLALGSQPGPSGEEKGAQSVCGGWPSACIAPMGWTATRSITSSSRPATSSRQRCGCFGVLRSDAPVHR